MIEAMPSGRRVAPRRARPALTSAARTALQLPGVEMLRLGALVAAALLGLVVVLLRHQLLPDRFFFDSANIQRIATSGSARDFDNQSYGSVAAVFRLLHLESNELLVGLLSYALAVVVIAAAVRARRYRTTWAATGAGVVALLLAAVYLSTYTKDVFLLPVALVAITARSSWKGQAAVLAALLLYADLFRTYWFVVAAVYVLFLLAQRLVPVRLVATAGPVVALVLIGLATHLLLGKESDFARQQVNGIRLAAGVEDARTMITPWVSLPAPLGSIVNTVLVLLAIVVPVPLLLKGSPYYLGISAVFVLVWVCFFVPVWRTRHWDALGRRAVCLLVAVLTTQALFEPDFGSVLRHLTPMLALAVVVAMRPAALEQAARTDPARASSRA